MAQSAPPSLLSAVGKKLPLDFEFMGEQAVKNIDNPVRAYHVRLRPGADATDACRQFRIEKIAKGLAVDL